MIPLSPALPALSSEVLSLYCTKDPLLDDLPVLVFYGPATTGNSTQSSSRVQAHIYSLAGFQSFPRLTVAPTSPLYAAVSHLPAEQQGDEVSRGLAMSLLSYFAGLPKEMKQTLRDRAATTRPNGFAPMMFDEMHAGGLAANMELVEDSGSIANYVMSALSRQVLSWVNMDVILPTGTIQRATCVDGPDHKQMLDEQGLPLFSYGQHSSIVEQLGSSAFLPTSKLQRAPSRPTAHSKSKVLSKDQKISLRQEMCELIDTESSYLGKMNELAHSVVVEFQKETNSSLLHKLFPGSLTQILELNKAFFVDLQSVLDETENEAIRDIEGGASSDSDFGSPITQGRRRDPTGTTQVARALLRWFPEFITPYQNYLRASTNFSMIIGQLLSDTSSGISEYLHTFGEQRLRSALIEPVQRLPRYSLLIDNMVALLPASHPALISLSKARDVITDICSLDASSTMDSTRSGKILRNLVANWPASCSPQGRLIAAVDIRILKPPYAASSEGASGLLLLFAGMILILEKVAANALSARGILAEVGHPTARTSAIMSSAFDFDQTLSFGEAFDLSSLRFSESEDGHLIRLARSLTSVTSIQNTKVLYLRGSYDGKAGKLSEEFVKAMTEGQYSENTRDSGKWALRTINPSHESLGVLLALSENLPETPATIARKTCPIQLYVNGLQDTRSILAQDRGIDVAACITTSEPGNYRINTEGADGTCYTDKCTSENLAGVLLARLGNLVRLQNQPYNHRVIESRILYHHTILHFMPTEKSQEDVRPRGFRPISPVKLISNFLSSQPSTPFKHRHNASVTKDVPAIPPPTPSKSSAGRDIHFDADPSMSKVNLVDSCQDSYKSPIVLLEDTFAAYVVALRSRSGNVVGRVLRSRASADELEVNELYNILLEDPSRLQAAAEVSVDVLFAAFEKFVRKTWQERMGPLLSIQALQGMHSASDSGKPVLFSQYVKTSLEDMSPQNRRAFGNTVKLLSDLLDASGNDGDRGALIVSFAEVLVLEGNPRDSIHLLDRLVDDYDNLFEVYSTGLGEGKNVSGTGSLTRTRSFNTGSLSSNASSLKRRFGLGHLSRENSKNEPESKVASIWRTLSKNARSPGDNHSQPASLSKASLIRSRSTDTDSRMLPPLGPVSHGRPTTSGSASLDEPKSRPGSSHLNTSTLSSIGEGTPTKVTMLPKKKRRSSLSDLQLLKDPDLGSPWSPLQPRKLTNFQSGNGSFGTSPRAPLPVKRPSSQDSPQPSGIPRRFGSPQRKENSPIRETSPPKLGSPLMPRTPTANVAVKQRSDEVLITSFSPQKRQTSRSGIPAPKGGLAERTWPPNGPVTPAKKSAQSPQKLRMQSPQKIRERLSQEQKSLTISDESFQAEMTKIGEEMATYKLQRSPTKTKSTVPSSRSTSANATLEILSSQLATLANTLKGFTTTHTASLSSISADVDSSLIVSEKKARKLDELYREANAENEALYERFNDELGKILGRVKKGEGVDEMRSKLKEGQDEVGKLKRENAKLKRDVVGLRSLMKEG